MLRDANLLRLLTNLFGKASDREIVLLDNTRGHFRADIPPAGHGFKKQDVVDSHRYHGIGHAAPERELGVISRHRDRAHACLFFASAIPDLAFMGGMSFTN